MQQWLLPWIIAGLAVWPLVHVERWIHKHIQGLGLLLTNNPQAAVLIYYLSLLPGVVLHESSQWLLAQILRVRIRKFELWPQKQGKLIRLGLVEIDKRTDFVRATLIGMVPLASGVAMISLIGSVRFDTGMLLDAVATGDLPTIVQGLNTFIAVPDFVFWLYLIFAIANAMLPEPHDRINWWLPVGAMAAVTLFLLLLDLNIVLRTLLEGPLAKLAQWLSFALVTALVIDLIMMGIISIAEFAFSRILNRELEYKI